MAKEIATLMFEDYNGWRLYIQAYRKKVRSGIKKFGGLLCLEESNTVFPTVLKDLFSKCVNHLLRFVLDLLLQWCMK